MESIRALALLLSISQHSMAHTVWESCKNSVCVCSSAVHCIDTNLDVFPNAIDRIYFAILSDKTQFHSFAFRVHHPFPWSAQNEKNTQIKVHWIWNRMHERISHLAIYMCIVRMCLMCVYVIMCLLISLLPFSPSCTHSHELKLQFVRKQTLPCDT